MLVVVGLTLTLAACGGAAAPSAPTGGGVASPAAAAPEPSTAAGGSGASGAAGGGNGFEGSLAGSGQYTATWTVAPDMEAGPFNSVNNATMTSDKGTFGNIKVLPDGSVSFGSAATELGSNSSYDGTGAKVTLDATGQFVCAFTFDNDLKGNNDGAILHMSGGLTAHWHPEGIGDLSCP